MFTARLFYAPLYGGAFHSLPALVFDGSQEGKEREQIDLIHEAVTWSEKLNMKQSIVMFSLMSEEDQSMLVNAVQILRQNGLVVIGEEWGDVYPEYLKYVNHVQVKITEADWLWYAANDIIYAPDTHLESEIPEPQVKKVHKNCGYWLMPGQNTTEKVFNFLEETNFLWRVLPKRPIRMDLE